MIDQDNNPFGTTPHPHAWNKNRRSLYTTNSNYDIMEEALGLVSDDFTILGSHIMENMKTSMPTEELVKHKDVKKSKDILFMLNELELVPRYEDYRKEELKALIKMNTFKPTILDWMLFTVTSKRVELAKAVDRAILHDEVRLTSFTNRYVSNVKEYLELLKTAPNHIVDLIVTNRMSFFVSLYTIDAMVYLEKSKFIRDNLIKITEGFREKYKTLVKLNMSDNDVVDTLRPWTVILDKVKKVKKSEAKEGSSLDLSDIEYSVDLINSIIE